MWTICGNRVMICAVLIALWSTACSRVGADGLVSLATSQGPYQVEAADLDGDRYPDLLVPCRGDLLLPEEKRPGNDILTVYLSAGKGVPSVRRDFRVGFGPYTVAVGDIDGDGIQDAAVANFQANDGRHLSLLWGAKDRNAIFEPDAPITIDGAPFRYEKNYVSDGRPMYPTPGLTSVAIADFNRDGRLDMVAAAYSSEFFVVLQNQGNRQFTQRRFPLLPGPRDVAVADFDGDAKLDLAFTIYSSNLVQVFRGNGRGGFIEWQHFHTQGHIPYHLKAADIDRDGRIDIVVGNRGPSDNAVVFHNERSGFRCIGSFETDTPVTAESTTDEIRDVMLTDADGDGVLDLFAACRLSDKVIFWHGTGDPSFGKAFTNRTVRQFPVKGTRALVRFDDTLAVVCYGSSEVLLMPISDWLKDTGLRQ